MKKRIVIYLACLAGLVLASSCSVHDTVMKRHYMKGYYVGKHQRAHSPAATSRSNNEVNADEMTARLELSLIPEEIEPPALGKRTEGDISPVTLSKTTKSTKSTKASAGFKVPKIQIAKPSLHLKEMVELKKPLASDSGGLSLFWIVILVILILWAIGFLGGGFGLGSLINLLLLVALILLILWLLRII